MLPLYIIYGKNGHFMGSMHPKCTCAQLHNNIMELCTCTPLIFMNHLYIIEMIHEYQWSVHTAETEMVTSQCKQDF